MVLCTAREIRQAEKLCKTRLCLLEDRLMDAAAEALYEAVIHDTPEVPAEVLVLCGSSNNAADGYTLAALLCERDVKVQIVSVFEPSSPLCRERAKLCAEMDIPCIDFCTEREWEIRPLIENAAVIVDCIFGIGFEANREPREEFVRVCEFLNYSGAFVISADVPSGLDCDTGRYGEQDGNALVIGADLTVTFSASKPALETAPGLGFAGKIKLADVGVPEEILEEVAQTTFFSSEELLGFLPRRHAETSKADYGRLLAYCGSRTMPGAGRLAALGSLRSGVGLLSCVGEPEALNLIAASAPEPIYLPFRRTADDKIDLTAALDTLKRHLPRQTAVMVGCGIGTGETQEALLERILLYADCPVICDADALTILSRRKDLLCDYGHKLVLTPHPGEMGRLCAADAAEIQKGRIYYAQTFAEQYGCTLVLKGHRSVIASPDGSLCINRTGNPGMAKAGMGDLLCGIIAAFLAQGVPSFTAACLGVFLHGKAGDITRDELGEISMLPSDCAARLHKAFLA